MGPSNQRTASIQAYFPPTPAPSPTKNPPDTDSSTSPSTASPSQPTDRPEICDGFTPAERQRAIPPATPTWTPETDYEDVEIADLQPGPRAVTFMGRVASLADLRHAAKTPRAARGGVRMVVRDGGGAVTVRLWYATRLPSLRLGGLVSVWTNHISNGENGSLSSASAPLFASIFPERDRSCHFMVHENSDDGQMLSRPLGYREGRPLSGLMTLQNFVDGGYDVLDAKILVVVKSIGAKKTVTRKDESTVENVELQVHDDTAEATLGLWGIAALSPFATNTTATTNPEAAVSRQSWKPGETVILLQSPSCKIARRTYLTLTSTTLTDLNPAIPDTLWLRRWATRTRTREALNPPFPAAPFDPHTLEHGPVRCLYTLAALDEFARAAPTESFQGYLSVVLAEPKLLECWRRRMLCCGECCGMAAYANAVAAACRGCDGAVALRLNPRIVGQVVDETGAVGAGKLLLSDRAWRDLLGREVGEVLRMGFEEVKHLTDRLLFCRVTLLFGWTGDKTVAGGRVCVLGVRA